MRMDTSAELDGAPTSSTSADERELATIFRRYGEERYARQIARAIVRRRDEQPFERTGDLVDTIKAAIPAPARFGDGHPAKRVFQALRIAVNDELGALEEALPAAVEMLRPGGRLAVISFHSLEDRIVKRFLREQERGCTCPPDFPVCVCGNEPVLRAIGAQARAAGRRRARRQPARRLGAAARGGEGLMAASLILRPSWAPRPAAAPRAAASRARARQARAGASPAASPGSSSLARPARRRRRPERRRAAAEPADRRARPRAAAAPRAERSARVAGLQRRRAR